PSHAVVADSNAATTIFDFIRGFSESDPPLPSSSADLTRSRRTSHDGSTAWRRTIRLAVRPPGSVPNEGNLAGTTVRHAWSTHSCSRSAKVDLLESNCP